MTDMMLTTGETTVGPFESEKAARAFKQDTILGGKPMSGWDPVPYVEPCDYSPDEYQQQIVAAGGRIRERAG